MKGITDLKTDNPALWSLSNSDLATQKEQAARSFMIPLDDTVSFVESTNLQSYHSNAAGFLYDLMGGPGRVFPLKEIKEKLGQWTPKRPGLFQERDLARRRYMPALVFPKANPS